MKTLIKISFISFISLSIATAELDIFNLLSDAFSIECLDILEENNGEKETKDISDNEFSNEYIFANHNFFGANTMDHKLSRFHFCAHHSNFYQDIHIPPPEQQF